MIKKKSDKKDSENFGFCLMFDAKLLTMCLDVDVTGTQVYLGHN